MEPLDPHAPEIQVLGPVALADADEPGYRLDALAALIYLRPGQSPQSLCEAMDPDRPWSRSTLHTRLSELRVRLGADGDGEPYLPRDQTRIRLSSRVRCDWTRFQTLARRGRHKGQSAGVRELEAALALVRGRPLSGPSGELPWATPLVQEMTVRITEVAHTLAAWHRSAGDFEAARRAVTTGLSVSDGDEVLYQDWMLIEDAAGNRPGVYTAIEQLQAANRRLGLTIRPETEAVIAGILSPAPHAQGQ
ncbi:AfsR/SARP family transcriptional regulator [Streptomyces nanshensis]|uniref:AfsR/SARP family transcriptional regulator n=1 Tax=Streptomyces nanshensis TaxID=518642 RepID=UPI001C0DC86F|nr:bacterial transcriptional activator domain-containing protein [Streptomyces nanshensis]